MHGRASCVAFCLCVSLAAPASACGLSDQEKQALFKQFDTDHDQRISQEEYVAGEKTRAYSPPDEKRMAFYATRFAAMDAGKTGFIALTEFDPIPRQKCL